MLITTNTCQIRIWQALTIRFYMPGNSLAERNIMKKLDKWICPKCGKSTTREFLNFFRCHECGIDNKLEYIEMMKLDAKKIEKIIEEEKTETKKETGNRLLSFLEKAEKEGEIKAEGIKELVKAFNEFGSFSIKVVKYGKYDCDLYYVFNIYVVINELEYFVFSIETEENPSEEEASVAWILEEYYPVIKFIKLIIAESNDNSTPFKLIGNGNIW